jgi:transposase
MKKTLSLDLRQRILDCYDAGTMTRQEVADRFCVSLGMVKKLIRQRKAIGEIDNLYHRVGRKPAISQAMKTRMAEAVGKRPDITLAELREKFGLDCSVVTVHNALASMGLTYKKKPQGERAGSRRRQGRTPELEAEDGLVGSEAPCLHRRNRREDEHDPSVRPRGEGDASPRFGATWTLVRENLDFLGEG